MISKIGLISSRSNKIGINLEEIFSDFFRKELRNAFYHSLYKLTSKDITLIKSNKVITYTELTEITAKAINFFLILAGKSNDIIEQLPFNIKNKYEGMFGELYLTKMKKNGYIEYLIEEKSM